MKVRLLLTVGLLAPVFLVLSCDESNSPTEPVIDQPADETDGPSFTTVGFGSFWHDPHISGAKIYCFSGFDDTKALPPEEQFHGQCKRFRTKDGAEVNTFDGDENPNNNYGGIYPAKNNIKGKLLRKVLELDFSYAGGAPSGGSPRFSIPIDECLVDPAYVGTTQYPPCTTDGATDGYAFADVTASSGCNDGDGFVGVLNGEDDESCNWFYKNEMFTSWTAFETAHPDWRIARDAVPFVIIDQPGHYLLFKLDIR